MTFNRACIYFIYDKDGIVDDYVIRQLSELRPFLNYLLVVINGFLTQQSRDKLENIADSVFIRENKGLDAGAYRDSIQHIGWDVIRNFDELVLMNFTCFGPIFPFSELFKWSSEQKVDLWAITRGLKVEFLSNYLHQNHCKSHYQSNFLAIRKSLLTSDVFKDFIDEIPKDLTYLGSGHYFEYGFPGFFNERGFKGAVYCNEEEEANYSLLHDPIKLLGKYRIPLIKVRSFFHPYHDTLQNTAGESAYRLLHFIEKNTKYPTELIWKYLLRTKNLADLTRQAALKRVLSNEIHPKEKSSTKIGVIYHAFYPDLFDDSLSYLKNFPSNACLMITTNSEEKKVILENKLKTMGMTAEIKVAGNRGRDVSSLLVEGRDFIKNFDLVCFAHDKKSSQLQPSTLAKSWAYKLHENVCGSRCLIENIVHLFDKEPLLGIAFPPYPNHGPFAMNMGTGWMNNYSNTKKLLHKLDIQVATDENTLCVAPLGTCFWFRPKALTKLFNGLEGNGWKYSDFPAEPNGNDNTLLHAIERAYAYCAQDAGYYPCTIYNTSYLPVELTSLEFNQSSAGGMRRYMEISIRKFMGVNENSAEFLAPSYENYGIKTSLVILAQAIRRRFPRAWCLLLPMRKLAVKLLRLRPN